MQTHIDDKLMTDERAHNISALANEQAANIKYDHYKTGATFVPIKVVMIMKETRRYSGVIFVIDNDFD